MVSRGEKRRLVLVTGREFSSSRAGSVTAMLYFKKGGIRSVDFANVEESKKWLRMYTNNPALRGGKGVVILIEG